jgi:hypothetical protein
MMFTQFDTTLPASLPPPTSQRMHVNTNTCIGRGHETNYKRVHCLCQSTLIPLYVIPFLQHQTLLLLTTLRASPKRSY